MQFIDFLTFIVTMVLITFLLRQKKNKQESVQESNEHFIKSKGIENFLDEEESIKKMDSSIHTELSELQKLLLGTKRQKKTVISKIALESTSLENEKKIINDAYDIVPEKKVRSATTLIQTAKSKKDLILIHEIFDKPKSLR